MASTIHDPVLITTSAQIHELVAELKRETRFSFDTEFIRENTFYPMIELIQIATLTKSWVVDARAFKKGFKPGPQGGYDPAIEPLLALFRDPAILKIVHAAQGDQECIYASFGVVATPTIDTAVAGSLCGFGDSVGLGRLLQEVLGVELKKGHSRTHWGQRPLPPQLLEYAHGDVEHLVRLADTLMAELDKSGRLAWAKELTAKWEDTALYEPDLEEWASRLARGARLDGLSTSVLRELLEWREKRVRTLNLPRRWVADDAVLVDLAKVKPEDVGHLAAFRGLNKGELKNSGQEILAAIAHGKASPRPSSSRVRVDSPTPAESQAIDLLQCYISVLASKHKVAAKHFLTVAQLLPLIRKPPQKAEDLVSTGALGPEAARLIGQEVVAMLRGERALRIVDRSVKVVRNGWQNGGADDNSSGEVL